MKMWLHRIELYVDLIIPYALFILIGLLAFDYFFRGTTDTFSSGILYVDNAVIFLLVTDLSFKFHRAKGVKGFLRNNWIEIIAAIPFVWIFRLFEKIIVLRALEAEVSSLNQNYKIEVTFLRLVRQLGQESLLLRFNRILELFVKPDKRVMKVLQFFEKPSGHHYHHEKN